MVEFKKMKYDYNKYVVNGIITDSDIDYFNSLNERTVFVLKNTKGLSSYVISKINNNNILFSILGGHDNILKSDYIYKDRYRERTYLSYMGLATILYYFEHIEGELEYDWTDTQKAMYVYSVLASNIEYVSDFAPEEFIKKNVMPRSLNGILYNKLTCTGFALTFKEMMDRLGIECYFQNKTGSHDFNVIKLDGNFYGIDVTWDNCYGKDTNLCEFKQFGRDLSFYSSVYHRKGVFVSDSLYDDIQSGKIDKEEWTQSYIDWEFDLDYSKTKDKEHMHFVPFADDLVYDIKYFSDSEYEKNLNVIKEKLLIRKKIFINLDKSSEKIRKIFLPYDTFGEKRRELEEKEKKKLEDRFKSDLVKDYQIFKMYGYLDKYNLCDKKISNIFKIIKECRLSYVLDFVYGFSLEYSDELIEGYNKIKDLNKIDNSEINDLIKSQLLDYIYKLIDELIKQISIYLNSYSLFKASNDEYDKMVVTDIYSKIKMLLNGKDELINFGYRSDEINKAYNLCKEYFDIMIKDDQIDCKEKDLDFIYEVFSDLEDIRKCMETYEEKELEDREFISKFTNIDYMMKIFDKLIDYNITKEEYEELFNKIICERNKKVK